MPPESHPLSPSIGLDLALTSRCPLRCRFCTVPKTPLIELSASEWREVVSDFARLRPIQLISLEGGEPMTRRDLPEILAASLEYAFQAKLVTSGVVPLADLPPGLLKHPRFILEVSVDGPQAVHNFLRDGSYAPVWGLIRSALAAEVRLRLRSVVSAFNIGCLEAWLEEVDKDLSLFGATIGYRFDTLIAPEAIQDLGGPVQRLGLRTYDSHGLIPSPAQIRNVYENLRRRKFRCLRLEQTEALRGCGAGRLPSISFDPAGMFSFCCEVPFGFGSIRTTTPADCLRILDDGMAGLPCRSCVHLRNACCDGCWTGQKCGMVGYWHAPDCATLIQSIVA